jgi:hypothetical protein
MDVLRQRHKRLSVVPFAFESRCCPLNDIAFILSLCLSFSTDFASLRLKKAPLPFTFRNGSG